jgi:hypothetical protein
VNHEYDEIDRALFALPLEEPPKDLRRAILEMTIYAPRAEERTSPLEWLAVGLGLALAAVLAWAVIAKPSFGAEVVAVLMIFGRGFLNPATLAGLTAGCSAVAWVSLMSFRPARIEVRSGRS